MLSGGRYDLLHTHEEASFFGILLAKLFRIPHLYDMHSSLVEQLSNMHFSRAKPLVHTFSWLERRVINSSVAVITICPSLEQRVVAINNRVPQAMIENVATERDPQTVSQEEVQALRGVHQLADGKKVVLYAGTLETYQGIDLLLESARSVISQIDDVLFLVVGGKPEQVGYYREQASRMGVADHFHFTGIRPPAEVPLFVNLSHVLVSPRTEGTNTPLKIYSYLQSGKPIVATDLFTHTQVLDSDVSVLVQPNAEAFAQGIVRVLEDPQFAAQLGVQARRLYQTLYSYETYMRKTEEILRLALGSLPPPREEVAHEAD
jgi:glycosyltransferase involved in cell wall biosynthesis